ncbi:MAG: PadR family transcriptional regulator [Lachnospiraceae bacterium]|nr:PadR family transcriptional regulator [Lachnospiraceae bacterium]
MSTIDLIILGLLCQSPKSAYDLQKQIETRNLSRWVKVGSFTVYKKVSLYETKGYVTSQTIKNGKMPEKTIYTITQSGKDVFKELMSKFSLSETRVFLDFNAVIVNLSLLDNDSIMEYVTNIRNSIQTTKAQISEQLSKQKSLSLFGQTILEQQFILLKALEDWENNFERQLLKERNK